MQGTGGRFSKFQERLYRMRLFRKGKKVKSLENEKFVQEKVQEIRDAIRNDPTPVRITRRVRPITLNQKDSKKQEDHFLDKSPSKEIHSAEVFSVSKKEMTPTDNESRNVAKAEGILKDDLPYIEERDSLHKLENQDHEIKHSKLKRDYSYKKRGGLAKDTNHLLSEEEKKDYLKEFGSDIIIRLKSQFENYLDQVDVLMGELYLLDKSQENELERKKIVEIRKKIQEMIQKIHVIIEQYNLYNRNYYIDSVVGLEDNELADDIIAYRDLLNSSSEKKFVKEFKALEEFQGLYRELKGIRERTVSVLEKNEDKILEYDIRDRKYAQIQLGMIQVDSVLKGCSDEMNRQSKYFNDLMEKVGHVDQREYSTYHLRGMGELLSGSFRYMGYLLLSPFSGFLPSIALRTLATREMVRCAYQQLHTEEVRHIRYEAIDYANEISKKITDIDYTSNLIDHTLGDISKLREDFMLQYNCLIPGYEETLRRIDDIYISVVHSQNRVEMIRKNLKKSQKINEDKLMYVKKMNQE